MGSTDHEQFLFRAQRLGGHVHVHVWAGTRLQADNHARPKLGMLIMDPEQWTALRDLIANGQPYALGEFEVVDYDQLRYPQGTGPESFDCPEAAPYDGTHLDGPCDDPACVFCHVERYLRGGDLAGCTCSTGTGLGCPRHDPRYGEPEPETGPVEGRRFGPAFPEGAA
jgi:hypothetical protein